MKSFKIIFLLILFVASGLSISAQNDSTSAKEEFESYERNFSQVTKAESASSKLTNKRQTKSTGKKTKKPVSSQTKQIPVTKTASLSVGSPGMKIWLEKQVNCAGAFSTVAPTSVFKTGDCVRARFRLNFEGYLTIVNYGSSGSVDKIFPLDNQSNKIFPKTDNFIPDNQGWEFFDEKGDENLFFVISKQPLTGDVSREIERSRNAATERSQESEVYDRDLKPRTEKNEIFILAGEARLEKPLIFRLTLKHR